MRHWESAIREPRGTAQSRGRTLKRVANVKVLLVLGIGVAFWKLDSEYLLHSSLNHSSHQLPLARPSQLIQAEPSEKTNLPAEDEVGASSAGAHGLLLCMQPVSFGQCIPLFFF